MIKSVENSDLSFIYSFCENSLLGTKISCQLKAYGLERDFLNTWYYRNNDEITAVICKFEDSITLLAKEDDDLSEIKAFLDMLGYASLCCTKRTATALGFDSLTVKNAYVFIGNKSDEKLEDLSEERYKEAYKLIGTNIPDSFTDSEEAYLSFLSDFSFRKRRGLARIKGSVIDGKTASCALTSAETATSAVISGVACDLNIRKKGLGKKTVLSLVNELLNESKTVYVIALNQSAEGFYEHIGFKNTEKISFVERK